MSDWIVKPIGRRLLIKKDSSRSVSRGGILLPSVSEIPTLTGVVQAVGSWVNFFNVEVNDKVIVNPCSCIPVDLEDGNDLFIVDYHEVIAVFRSAPVKDWQ